MNQEQIIELAREAGFKVDWQHADVAEIKAQRYVAFANAVIKAHEAKLIDGVGEPVAWLHENAVGLTYYRKHRQGDEFNPVGLYTASQVAAAVAKAKNNYLNGYCEGRKEMLERIATLESENTALLAANRDCIVHFETLKVDYDKAMAALKVALEALNTVEWHGGGSCWIVDADAICEAIEKCKEVLHG